MTITQVSVWRNWVGKAGALFCILLFLSLLDALVARVRDPLNHFPCLPGQEVPVTGPLAEKNANLQELIYLSNSKDIRLVFDSAQTGFWLGGYMWRGRIIVSREAQPGEYKVAVPTPKATQGKSVSLFQVAVFKDESILYKASTSFIRRFLGISPWGAALFFTPFILLAFGSVFFLSQKAEGLLAKEGKAEVYRVAKGENGYQIYFSLGSKQGILPGASLTLFNGQKQTAGVVTVQEVFQDHSIAQTNGESSVRPGFIVSRSG